MPPRNSRVWAQEIAAVELDLVVERHAYESGETGINFGPSQEDRNAGNTASAKCRA